MCQIIKSYNILFLVVKMFEEHIFTSIQQKIGFSLKNSHLMVRGELSSSAIRSLPQLSPHQIRMLCKAQQQAILQRILMVRPLDIYEEIAAVCPQGKDIKTISNEEVDQRIGSKLLLTNREMSSEDEGSSYEDNSREESFFSQINADGIGGMELIEEEPNLPGEFNSMCKIFEICDNHNIWNPQDILEFN